MSINFKAKLFVFSIWGTLALLMAIDIYRDLRGTSTDKFNPKTLKEIVNGSP